MFRRIAIILENHLGNFLIILVTVLKFFCNMNHKSQNIILYDECSARYGNIGSQL